MTEAANQPKTVKILISFISDGDAVPEWYFPSQLLKGKSSDEIVLLPETYKQWVVTNRNHWKNSVRNIIHDGSERGVPEPGMLVKIMRRTKPNHVIALYMNEFKAILDANINYIQTHPQEFGEDIDIRTISLDRINDPSDYTELRDYVPKLVNDELRTIASDNCGEALRTGTVFELLVNAASGTQQMITILYSAVNFKNIPELSLNMIPEEERYDRIHFFSVPRWNETSAWKDVEKLDENEKAPLSAIKKIRENEVREFKLDFLSEASAFERMEKAARKYDFHLLESESYELWKNRPNGTGRSLAYALWQVCKAAQLADQMNFGKTVDDSTQKSAISMLNDLQLYLNRRDGTVLRDFTKADYTEKGRLVKKVLAWIPKYHSEIKNLVSSSRTESAENLLELYHNINRCYERGSYADVLARYYRLIEGLTYYVLLKKYSMDARDSGKCHKDAVNKSPSREKEIMQEMMKIYEGWKKEDVKKFHKGKVTEESFTHEFYPETGDGLGFYKAYKLLHFYTEIDKKNGDSGAVLFIDDKAEDELMDNIRDTRNQTFVAHGMGAVNKVDAQNAKKILDELMKRVYNMRTKKGSHGERLFPVDPQKKPVMCVENLLEFIEALKQNR